jgi:hypothetical protein
LSSTFRAILSSVAASDAGDQLQRQPIMRQRAAVLCPLGVILYDHG